jgi:hypothetical protein
MKKGTQTSPHPAARPRLPSPPPACPLPSMPSQTHIPCLLHLQVMCDRSRGWPTATLTCWPTRGSADLKGITRDMPLWKKGRMMVSLQEGGGG